MRRTRPEIRAYIEQVCAGRKRSEIAAMVNERFGTAYTPQIIGSCLKNWGLRTGAQKGLPKGHRSAVFPEEVAAWIETYYIGTSPADMAKMLNERFGTDYTRNQLKTFYSNHHLCSGLDGRFQSGHVPENKGKKWSEFMSPESQEGSRRTQFKKRHLPHNTKPIGWERVNSESYTEVKVRMRPSSTDCNDNFVLKQRLIWEQAHGPIPDDCIVIFKDGNKQNFDIENLMLISRAQNAVMNHSHLRSTVPEFVETSAKLADLRSAVYRKQQERRKKA